ncbi:MAG: S16 family serine protease [Nitriliruptoraceae bacterium]
MSRRAGPALRWLRRVIILGLLVLILPVPWLHVVSDDPLGTAWRLDGRLQVAGEEVDPPGRWTWLAVGRPAIVAELLHDRFVDEGTRPVDLRTEPMTLRPALAEPAAAAVGLRHAGVEVPLGLLVEASGPLVEGLPERAIITEVGGVPLVDRGAWERATDLLGPPPEASITTEGSSPDLASAAAPLTFETANAGSFEVDWTGEGLPYQVVRTLDTAPESLEARIVFAALERLPIEWFRELSLGSSHGLMVALTTYAHASGHDLARGRHIAGTGGIRGDGTVVPIGGLEAKATAARRAGADVLFVPASQSGLLGRFEPGTMTVVPVASLEEAISYLTGPTA